MQPLGHTIYQWRLERKLTQNQLAELCGVSRPNLSAIEQGARDVTLKTLKRLASGLGITAGTLADGRGPDELHEKPKWGRFELDRIGRLAAGQRLLASSKEKESARELSSVMNSKIRGAQTRNIRRENETISSLKTKLGSELFEHLIKRVEKNL